MFTVPKTERKPTRVQMRGFPDSSLVDSAMPSIAVGVDPMSTVYLDSSIGVDLSSTKATLGSQTDGAAYVTAPITVDGPSLSYLTADLTADD